LNTNATPVPAIFETILGSPKILTQKAVAAKSIAKPINAQTITITNSTHRVRFSLDLKTTQLKTKFTNAPTVHESVAANK